VILDDAKVETVPQFFREDGGKSKRRTRPGDWSFRPVDALRAKGWYHAHDRGAHQ